MHDYWTDLVVHEPNPEGHPWNKGCNLLSVSIDLLGFKIEHFLGWTLPILILWLPAVKKMSSVPQLREH
jgi:hypothetical protein